MGFTINEYTIRRLGVTGQSGLLHRVFFLVMYFVWSPSIGCNVLEILINAVVCEIFHRVPFFVLGTIIARRGSLLTYRQLCGTKLTLGLLIYLMSYQFKDFFFSVLCTAHIWFPTLFMRYVMSFSCFALEVTVYTHNYKCIELINYMAPELIHTLFPWTLIRISM